MKILALIAILCCALSQLAAADDVIYRTYPFTLQNAAAATGNGTAADVGGLGTVFVMATITGTATVTFEGSGNNGTTWASISATPSTGGTAVSTATTSGAWYVSVVGCNKFRARVSSYSSGNVTVIGRGIVTAYRPSGGGSAALISGTTTISGGNSSAILWDHSGVVDEIPPINGGGAPAIGWNGSDSLNFNNQAKVNFNTSTGGGITWYGGGGWGMATPDSSTLRVTSTAGTGVLSLSGVGSLDGASTTEAKNFVDPTAAQSLATKNYVDNGSRYACILTASSGSVDSGGHWSDDTYAISWSTAVLNTGSMWSSGTPKRVTIAVTGNYIVIADVHVTDFSGNYGVTINKNNGTDENIQFTAANSTGWGGRQQLWSGVIHFTASDYFTVIPGVNTGGISVTTAKLSVVKI